MEIRTTQYCHTAETDGLELSAVRREPADDSGVRGAVLIVHGMCEHKERYAGFAQFLAEHGYITVIFDLRGHGGSVKSQDDLGHWYEGGLEAMLADIHEMVLETKRYAAERVGNSDAGELPFAVVAHSMGTLLMRCYLREHDDELDCLALSGCPSKPSGARMGLGIVKLLKAVRGGHARPRLVDSLVNGGYERRFAKERTLHSWINSDPEEVRIYNEDPLCGFRFTLNGYENLIRATLLTYKSGGSRLRNPGLPIRFFSGGEDPCAISRRKLGDAIRLLRGQGYTDVRGKIYPGMRHEILREREKETVWNDILTFLGTTEHKTEV